MKTNQFRAMMLVLLMAVVSLGMVNAQAITVSGTVTDAKDGTPLVGCSVQIKGTTKGTVTNMNGRYTIQAKKGETLLFQYIGYKQERRVVKSGTLDVKMKADELALEECVVVGYGHETRAAKVMSTAYRAVCPTPGIMPVITALFQMRSAFDKATFDFGFIIINRQFFFHANLTLHFADAIFHRLLMRIPIDWLMIELPRLPHIIK